MARENAWLTPLDVRIVDDSSYSRRKYRTLARLSFWSRRYGQQFDVEPGFETDFASIPQAALSVIGPIGDRAATLHDKLCRSGEIPRVMADLVFYDALRTPDENGNRVDDATAWLMWAAVAGATAGLAPPEDERYIA